MPIRLLAAISGRRSPSAPGATAARARRRRMAVESLEGRELMAANFTSALGVGAPSLTAAAVAADAAGDTFTAGYFSGSINLNPNGGGASLTASGNRDIYVAEYNKAGALAWAKDLPSSAGAVAAVNGITLDAAGNLALAGSFTGTTNLNPGGSGGSLTAATGRTDAFVAKFTGTGGFLWADRFEGTGTDQAVAVATDALGDVLATGSYTGATTFGATTLNDATSSPFVTKLGPLGNVLWAQGFVGTMSSSGTHIAADAAGDAFVGGPYQGTLTVGATTLSLGYGANSAYVAKLSPTGGISWAVGFGGTGNTTSGGLAVDPSGNVLVDGNFKAPATFGGITLTPPGGSYSGYAAKLNTGGVGVWAEQFSGNDNVYVNALATDGAGAAYLGGQFSGTGNFNPLAGTPTSLTSVGGTDVFVSKLDGSGNLVWANQAGGAGNDTSGALAVSAPDTVAAVGKYNGPASFGSTVLQTIDSTNMYVAQVTAPILNAPPGPADFLAASSVGGNIFDARAVAVDAAGNSYVTGLFNGTVDFDPGAGVTALTSAGFKDVYVAAYSPAGALLWAKDLPGSANASAQGNGIAVDAAGNIALTGTYNGSINFNPGGSGGTLTAAGGTDAFAAKLTGTGAFLWAKSLGGSANDVGTGVAVDAAGDTLVTGSVNGSGKFGTLSIYGAGGNDVFAAKIDPVGNVLWATDFGGYGSDNGGRIAVDASGNAYLSGAFTEGSIAYTNAAGSHLGLPGNASNPSVYTLKLNPAGGIVWADSFTGVGNTSAGGLAVDAAGDVFVSGTIRDTTSFGSIILAPNGYPNSNAFVAKINPSGAVAWAEKVGGVQMAIGTDVQVDSLGNVYLGGEFTGTTNFNPGTGAAANLNGFGALDIFVDKLDTNGNDLWARQAGGAGNDYLRAMAVVAPDDVRIVGLYIPSATFNTVTLNDQVDNSTGYLARIAQKTS